MEREALEKLIATLEAQENALRLEHFTRKDAWSLGCFVTERVYERGISLSVSIRGLGGEIIFQHLAGQTGGNNDNWMRRKFNTVRLMERSSLRQWAIAEKTGEFAADHGLDAADYVFCGGGFPLRLAGSELVGVLIVLGIWQAAIEIFHIP